MSLSKGDRVKVRVDTGKRVATFIKTKNNGRMVVNFGNNRKEVGPTRVTKAPLEKPKKEPEKKYTGKLNCPHCGTQRYVNDFHEKTNLLCRQCPHGPWEARKWASATSDSKYSVETYHSLEKAHSFAEASRRNLLGHEDSA